MDLGSEGVSSMSYSALTPIRELDDDLHLGSLTNSLTEARVVNFTDLRSGMVFPQ